MSEIKNSRLLGKITILVMVSFVVNTALALDGSGTQQDPWRIRSLDDFNDFAADANYWAGFTRLETDVNLAGLTYTTAVIAPDTDNSNSGFQGTLFTGVFDGNNHTISNFTYQTNGSYIGLFGYVDGPNSLVKDLILVHPDVNAVTGWYVGCLSGLIRDGILRNCSVIGGSVTGDERVGGLAGFTSSTGTDVPIGGTLIRCSTLNGTVSGNRSIGGLVGFTYFGTISNCYSTFNVSGNLFVGGLVGFHAVPLYNSFSSGDVSGSLNTGGLIGVIAEGGSVSSSFWDVDTSGQSWSARGTGKTTEEMQQQATFTDWDFINVWDIGENQTYPYLRTFFAADLNKDGIVNFLDIAITANQWMEEK